MAYVDQGKKARIAAALKKVVPAGWKYSLAVRNHSTIVMNISQAPVDLLGQAQQFNDRRAEQRGDEPYQVGGYLQVNPYYVGETFGDDHPLVAIKEALDLENFDKSDLMTDYFHVGHYVEINVGQWNKPFVCTAQAIAA